ncbi:MAG: hypothetical protein ABI175_30890 [Polyangiales bacterium]
MPGSDPRHWLHRLTADEWLRAGMKELSTARSAMSQHQQRPALASLRRAAGMGWNAVLALQAEPDARYGRSYADHLRALAGGIEPGDDAAHPVPAAVREAAQRLMDDPASRRTEVVQILTRARDEALLAAAETVLAEAYTRVLRASAPRPPVARP